MRDLFIPERRVWGEREGERAGQRKKLTQALKTVTQSKFENIKGTHGLKRMPFTDSNLNVLNVFLVE